MDMRPELIRMKAIMCELVQFFIFNLHLNYLTHDYTFSITDKPEPTGFSVVIDDDTYYYSTDKMEFLSHYILYVPQNDNLKELMNTASSFWSNDITSIHFFLHALKGNYIPS